MPFDGKPFDGIANLLASGVIRDELKVEGREIVGIVIDADETVIDSWNELRKRCEQQFPNIPEELPETGLIIKNADGQKLGIWIMPDNRSHGMLETFLLFLAPNETDALVTLATDVCRQAKHLGAPYKEVHQMKAHIYSWLAWQDEPGRQLHQAVKEHILKASSPYALPFVGWFRNLFEV